MRLTLIGFGAPSDKGASKQMLSVAGVSHDPVAFGYAARSTSSVVGSSEASSITARGSAGLLLTKTVVVLGLALATDRAPTAREIASPALAPWWRSTCFAGGRQARPPLSGG